MTTLLGPPHPYQVALLTDAQYDRLYLDWYERIKTEVAEAVAIATGHRQRRADTFAALQRDITAMPLTGPEQIERDTPAGHALDAQASLHAAKQHYARGDLYRAVSDLQEAALIAREVLTDLGWTPAP